MKDLLIILARLPAALDQIIGPDDMDAVVTDNLLLKQLIFTMNRAHRHRVMCCPRRAIYRKRLT